jgi:hypothetical protein
MTDEFMLRLRKAIEMVEQGVVKRADVDGAKVYIVPGPVIRVDIENKE